MKVLLIVAMDSELQGFLDRLDYQCLLIEGKKVYNAKVNNVDLYIGQTNIGKVNAAILTTILIDKINPSYVINSGIAGGLNPSCNVLDVVAGSKCTYHDFDLTFFDYKKGQMEDNLEYFKASEKLLSLVPDTIRRGQVVTGDQFISATNLPKLNQIKTEFPKALCCDMEGGAIAHVATLMSKEFILLKCISDNAFINRSADNYFDVKYEAISKVVDVTFDLLNKL